MLWRGGRQSGNIEDRRGISMGRGLAGGGVGAIILAVMALLFGFDPGTLVQDDGTNVPSSYDERGQNPSPAQDEGRAFAASVLADTEDAWHRIFGELGRDYVEPKLVLFSGAVESACGLAQSAVGPFYCPRDRKVY